VPRRDTLTRSSTLEIPSRLFPDAREVGLSERPSECPSRPLREALHVFPRRPLFFRSGSTFKSPTDTPTVAATVFDARDSLRSRDSFSTS